MLFLRLCHLLAFVPLLSSGLPGHWPALHYLRGRVKSFIFGHLVPASTEEGGAQSVLVPGIAFLNTQIQPHSVYFASFSPPSGQLLSPMVTPSTPSSWAYYFLLSAVTQL